jgi:hypothetical protein
MQTGVPAQAKRYHFDIRVGHLKVIDCVGQVCSTLQQAFEEAFIAALSAGEMGIRLKLRGLIIEVRESDGIVVLEFPVSAGFHRSDSL